MSINTQPKNEVLYHAPKSSTRPLPHPQPDGSIHFTDAIDPQKIVFAFEKGKLNIPLPSGFALNIFYDSRLQGQNASFSPEANGIIVTADTKDQIQNPNTFSADGWPSVKSRTDYLIKHEYTHMRWDRSVTTQEFAVNLLQHPAFLPETRAFGASLVSHPAYQAQEESDPMVDCFEYKFGGKTHRYSKDLIVQELFAHAAISQDLTDAQLNHLRQTDPDRYNFVQRSKMARDTLEKVQQKAPEQYAFLQQTGLVDSPQLKQDCAAIKEIVASL
jgi:hypothetical protein